MDFNNGDKNTDWLDRGGTAGLTLAARLVQSAKVSVAVIEAGGVYQEEQGNGSWIPALAYSQGTGTDPNEDTVKIDWGLISSRQKVRI